MKIILSAAQLLKNLQLLNGVVATSNTMPILDNFLFEFEGDLLEITASDLETTMTVKLEIESKEKASLCVPAKILIDVLKTLPDQPLVFDFLENNSLEINSNSGKYAIPYVSGLEFPKVQQLENPSRTIIPSSILSTAISKTIFATGNDDLRPVMCGVYFQFSNSGLIFTSTDAHKLVKYSRNDIQSDQEALFIMPKKPLSILKSVLESNKTDVLVEYNETNAVYKIENFELCCRLIDGKYPNYEAVIPKENPNELIINRLEFLKSVTCVSIFSNKSTHQIKLKLSNNQLLLSAEDKDFSNKGVETLTCNYQGSDMQIGFNARFVSEIIKNLSCEEIKIELSQPNRAGVITQMDSLSEGEDVLMLVMPTLISE